MEMNTPFNTNIFFSGGAGMFIQYHDVVKPARLYAVLKMILTKQTYGLPFHIIENFSVLSILEWYMNRRYTNPLQQLDFSHKLKQKDLDKLLLKVLDEDPSIYKIAPPLNVDKMFQVYRQQHMQFPLYIYTEEHEKNVKEDIEYVFHGIKTIYLYGDLEKAIKTCGQNFTYIFSDIELVKRAAEILTGTCSHLLLARDYRYNYTDNMKTLKYDLSSLMTNHPFVRIGTTTAMDITDAGVRLANILNHMRGE